MFEFSDASNRRLGYIDQSGAVYDTSNNLLGYSDGGNVLDTRRRVVGKVDANGTIFDQSGQVVGYADNSGTATNARRQVVGKFNVDNIGKFHVGALAVLTRVL